MQPPPEAYITNFTRLLQSSRSQDAEQNSYHGIIEGIDHADLLEVRAPKPTLMITTTEDFFSIQGARETASEVSRAMMHMGMLITSTRSRMVGATPLPKRTGRRCMLSSKGI
ncbi:MAG: hypothetical protein U5K69_30245 [Balneolaceae bacterium]|nr:hypothetical protein [Balneolaceae bacterium]